MEANVHCALKYVVSSPLSLARYLLHQVLCYGSYHGDSRAAHHTNRAELRAQTHLHATVRVHTTVITKTLLLPLLVHPALHAMWSYPGAVILLFIRSVLGVKRR